MTDFTHASLAAKSELQIAWLVMWADPCTHEGGVCSAWFAEEDAKIEAANLNERDPAGPEHYVAGYPLKHQRPG
jgi:hypothetical protein